jgi:hydrogenase-4 component F
LFWVFIEATTLMSAPFIYFERTRHSLEAVWKYVFICSIGIALAFAGVVVLLFGSTNLHSLYFSDLYAYAGQIDPFWLKISFLFMLVGFGTKAGLAPMHAWLPDAHSEAPAPISALLSGVILNTAFLGILRMQKVLDLAGAGQKAHLLLIAMGLISVFVSAVYMVRVSNYKRMLAYSSIENMGIAAIGIGVGGPAVFAAVLQIAAHSFTKAAFFMTSGNIYQKYGTKNAGMVRNLLQNDRLTGWLWIACFLSMAGFPPFPGFVAKFLLIKAMFAQGYAIVALILLALLVIILYGTGSTVIGMVFAGETAGSIREVKMGLSAYLPQAALIALLVFLGMYMPAVALKLFADAAGNL